MMDRRAIAEQAIAEKFVEVVADTSITGQEEESVLREAMISVYTSGRADGIQFTLDAQHGKV